MPQIYRQNPMLQINRQKIQKKMERTPDRVRGKLSFFQNFPDGVIRKSHIPPHSSRRAASLYVELKSFVPSGRLRNKRKMENVLSAKQKRSTFTDRAFLNKMKRLDENVKI
ncbi:hypothetical protein Barb6XT_02364 [Bacteroidales bacterium Barb6XT]|nr:hypothetical protein Barb6XT_02364 [Bacteroidales bacterium Barb6XT]